MKTYYDFAYPYFSDLAKATAAKGSHTSLKNVDAMSEDGIVTRTVSITQFFIPDSTDLSIDQNLFRDATTAELRLLVSIIENLKRNNPLWSAGAKPDANMHRIIGRLKAREILYPTKVTGIYFVNPEKIRRGRLLVVHAAFLDYMSRMVKADKRWKLSDADIKDLRTPDKTTLAITFKEWE